MGLVSCTGSHLSQPRIGALAPQHTRQLVDVCLESVYAGQRREKKLLRKSRYKFPLFVWCSLSGLVDWIFLNLFSRQQDPGYGLYWCAVPPFRVTSVEFIGMVGF